MYKIMYAKALEGNFDIVQCEFEMIFENAKKKKI